MNSVLWIIVFLATFLAMEGMAWFTHKFVMHGFLWKLHKDHHKKITAIGGKETTYFCVLRDCKHHIFLLWRYDNLWIGLPIGLGILAYGIAYFMVHDIFIHQRFKIFRNADNRYAKGVRRAHKMHHKHLGKEEGECFGMLWVPIKYFKK